MLNLSKIKEALELAKGFYGFCISRDYPVSKTKDFQEDYEKICNTLKDVEYYEDEEDDRI